GAQRWPQPPQFDGSVGNPALAYSQPSPSCPLQSTKPALQAPIEHVPAVHIPVAFCGAQIRPHPPQFDGSVAKAEVGFSQPSPGSALQSANPESQLPTRQAPPVHVPVACGGSQSKPHP